MVTALSTVSSTSSFHSNMAVSNRVSEKNGVLSPFIRSPTAPVIHSAFVPRPPPSFSPPTQNGANVRKGSFSDLGETYKTTTSEEGGFEGTVLARFASISHKASGNHEDDVAWMDNNAGIPSFPSHENKKCVLKSEKKDVPMPMKVCLSANTSTSSTTSKVEKDVLFVKIDHVHVNNNNTNNNNNNNNQHFHHCVHANGLLPPPPTLPSPSDKMQPSFKEALNPCGSETFRPHTMPSSQPSSRLTTANHLSKDIENQVRPKESEGTLNTENNNEGSPSPASGASSPLSVHAAFPCPSLLLSREEKNTICNGKGKKASRGGVSGPRRTAFSPVFLLPEESSNESDIHLHHHAHVPASVLPSATSISGDEVVSLQSGMQRNTTFSSDVGVGCVCPITSLSMVQSSTAGSVYGAHPTPPLLGLPQFVRRQSVSCASLNAKNHGLKEEEEEDMEGKEETAGSRFPFSPLYSFPSPFPRMERQDSGAELTQTAQPVPRRTVPVVPPLHPPHLQVKSHGAYNPHFVVGTGTTTDIGIGGNGTFLHAKRIPSSVDPAVGQQQQQQQQQQNTISINSSYIFTPIRSMQTSISSEGTSTAFPGSRVGGHAERGMRERMGKREHIAVTVTKPEEELTGLESTISKCDDTGGSISFHSVKPTHNINNDDMMNFHYHHHSHFGAAAEVLRWVGNKPSVSANNVYTPGRQNNPSAVGSQYSSPKEDAGSARGWLDKNRCSSARDRTTVTDNSGRASMNSSLTEYPEHLVHPMIPPRRTDGTSTSSAMAISEHEEENIPCSITFLSVPSGIRCSPNNAGGLSHEFPPPPPRLEGSHLTVGSTDAAHRFSSPLSLHSPGEELPSLMTIHHAPETSPPSPTAVLSMPNTPSLSPLQPGSTPSGFQHFSRRNTEVGLRLEDLEKNSSDGTATLFVEPFNLQTNNNSKNDDGNNVPVEHGVILPQYGPLHLERTASGFASSTEGLQETTMDSRYGIHPPGNRTNPIRIHHDNTGSVFLDSAEPVPSAAHYSIQSFSPPQISSILSSGHSIYDNSCTTQTPFTVSPCRTSFGEHSRSLSTVSPATTPRGAVTGTRKNHPLRIMHSQSLDEMDTHTHIMYQSEVESSVPSQAVRACKAQRASVSSDQSSIVLISSKSSGLGAVQSAARTSSTLRFPSFPCHEELEALVPADTLTDGEKFEEYEDEAVEFPGTELPPLPPSAAYLPPACCPNKPLRLNKAFAAVQQRSSRYAALYHSMNVLANEGHKSVSQMSGSYSTVSQQQRVVRPPTVDNTVDNGDGRYGKYVSAVSHQNRSSGVIGTTAPLGLLRSAGVLDTGVSGSTGFFGTSEGSELDQLLLVNPSVGSWCIP